VRDEWESFLALRPHWHEGRFHVVQLVDAPIPPFLERIHRVDFREASEDSYRQALRMLAGGLLGRADPRNLPEVPADCEFHPLSVPVLDPQLRSRLVDWLAPILVTKLARSGIAATLEIEPGYLEGLTRVGAASAASVLSARPAWQE
jgi:hypothetical protein